MWSVWSLAALEACTAVPGRETVPPRLVRVACVGDSITRAGHLPDPARSSYPALLQRMLGAGYKVRNFGVGGATMLRDGDLPYTAQEAFRNALAYAPDVVLIMLGTNDTCSAPRGNWEKRASFTADATGMLNAFREANPNVRLILAAPPDMRPDLRRLTAERRADLKARRPRLEQIRIWLREVAARERIEFVDMRYTTWGRQRVVDGVHPTPAAMKAIACRAWQAIRTQYDPAFELHLPPALNPRRTSFHGFTCIEFEFNGVPCRIACPPRTAAERPWVWRARFWGHQPQFDLAMLERGFHVVYCDVSNLFGAPAAVERWNRFYTFLREQGFHSKPFLEGMSRGGLIIHNWAAATPEKVSGIYADNAVLDIKSWPAGFGAGAGNRTCWLDCMKAYGFANEIEAKAWNGNPLDHLESLARARIPILYLMGMADRVVPPSENGEIAVRRYEALGGPVEVIRKPGKGHHPHSLRDPGRIVDFALKATGRHLPCPDI